MKNQAADIDFDAVLTSADEEAIEKLRLELELGLVTFEDLIDEATAALFDCDFPVAATIHPAIEHLVAAA